MSTMSQDVLARVDRERDGYLEELKDYLRIESISTDPRYRGEIDRCAEFVRAKMAAAGLVARIVDTGGHPLVYGEWTGAPGKPTVVFYGHYDVQPADPLDLWRHPPFEPTVEGEVLVARGATDDKGQSFTHLKAVGAILAERGALPINVKLIVEGEEESGGEAIERFVRDDGGRLLGCDCLVISDSPMYGPGQPSLVYGLKGLVYKELVVRGPSRDLHSGCFGGVVTNPLNAVAEIVARLRDLRTGRVLIPGFYDDVRELAAWEREELARLPFDEEAYRAEIGVPELCGEEGYTTMERLWGRPTCDVNGLYGGYADPGAKTVIAATGGVKVSMRLVPDQDRATIDRLFCDYVRQITPPGVTVEILDLHGAEPILVDTEGPLVEAAMSAMADVWQRPVRVREGGSIPIVSTFHQVLGVPILLLGFGLPDDRLHSPNEQFRLDNFYGGIRATVRMIDRMAEVETA